MIDLDYALDVLLGWKNGTIPPMSPKNCEVCMAKQLAATKEGDIDRGKCTVS